MNKEKKIIEQENEHILKSIESKRAEFFEEYEIDPPNKEHAIQLMQTIKNKVFNFYLNHILGCIRIKTML